MPVTLQQYERSLAAPALCEQLRIRDLLDNVAIQTDGSFVAGYELGGVHSYFASDEMRNRAKSGLEALVRSLPERSMRMQVRFETTEGYGDLVSRYNREQRNESPVLQDVDRVHADLWRKRDSEGLYLRHILHAYFIWNPRIHHQSPDLEWKKKMRGASASLSTTKCIERTRREHEDLLAEFNSLMSGVEATLQATGMAIRRMPHDSIFQEVKRALCPLEDDAVRYRPPETLLVYESARSQMANVNIEDETDDYLKIGGLLYSWISLKDLPDATFPGILRELMLMDFPLVVNAEVNELFIRYAVRNGTQEAYTLSTPQAVAIDVSPSSRGVDCLANSQLRESAAARIKVSSERRVEVVSGNLRSARLDPRQETVGLVSVKLAVSKKGATILRLMFPRDAKGQPTATMVL